MSIKTHESFKLLNLLLKKSGGDWTAATEAVQEAYLAALKSYHTFRHKSSYFTWLCRIALNKLADYYKQQTNQESKIVIPSVEFLNTLFDPSLTPEEQLSLDELKHFVNKCLDQLPERYRKLLHLKYYNELSNAEICVQLHLPIRSLEGKLYRAKKALSKIVIREKSSSGNT